jgi:hypothetical protein
VALVTPVAFGQTEDREEDAERPARAASSRIWVGGGIGLSFGTVDYVEVAPLIGYSATDKISIGGSVIYRYRKDGRFEPSVSTTDYGGSLFGRYQVTLPAFVHAEYEYLNYEFVRSDLSTGRDTYNSVLVGPGFSQSVGARASFFVLALYNLTYDSNDLRSPYTDPWVFRVGVGFGF